MRTSHGLENADLSSRIWRCLVQQKRSNVSEKAPASIFRVKDKGSSFPQNLGKNIPPIHFVRYHKAVIIMKHTFFYMFQSLCNVTCVCVCVYIYIYINKINQSHYRSDVPREFQEVKAPRFVAQHFNHCATAVPGMYVCAYVCMMYVCVYMCMYVCAYVCIMYVCMYVSVCGYR